MTRQRDRIDGERVRPSHRVRAGEAVEVSLPVLEKLHLLPDDVEEEREEDFAGISIPSSINSTKSSHDTFPCP